MFFNTEGKGSSLNLSSKSNSRRRCTEIGCSRTVCASKGLCRLTYMQSADQSRTWPVSKFGSSIYTPFEYSLDLIPVVCCHDRPQQQMRTHRFYYQFREREAKTVLFSCIKPCGSAKVFTMMTYQFCVCEYQHPVLFLDYLLLCTPIAIVFFHAYCILYLAVVTKMSVMMWQMDADVR